MRKRIAARGHKVADYELGTEVRVFKRGGVTCDNEPGRCLHPTANVENLVLGGFIAVSVMSGPAQIL
eukprot:scaffold70178_cov37-Phaeocystis_antarctica.AAC.2